MSSNQKIAIIDAAYGLLKEMRISELSARDVAAAANCSVDDIYTQFDNMDHLIRVTSVRILDDYSQQCQEAVKNISDPMELELELWKNFLPYAFRYTDVYELLFWSWGRAKIRDAFREYYDLFPERQAEIGYADVFLSTDIKGRNTVTLQNAAEQGYIKKEDIPVLVNLQIGLLHAMMSTYKDIFRTTGIPEKAAEKYIIILKSLHDHYRLK